MEQMEGNNYRSKKEEDVCKTERTQRASRVSTGEGEKERLARRRE